MKAWQYRGCTIEPVTMSDSILVACNNSVNRYLKKLWRITFPDGTWTKVGTKLLAGNYINTKGHSHGVAC